MDGQGLRAFVEDITKIKIPSEIYLPLKETKQQESRFQQRQNYINNAYHNILVKPSNLFPLSDYEKRVPFFQRNRVQELCRGTFERPAYLDKDLKCILLHHYNPFLKLGPYKVLRNSNLLIKYLLGKYLVKSAAYEIGIPLLSVSLTKFRHQKLKKRGQFLFLCPGRN